MSKAGREMLRKESTDAKEQKDDMRCSCTLQRPNEAGEMEEYTCPIRMSVLPINPALKRSM
jgi:hypothetical protein